MWWQNKIFYQVYVPSFKVVGVESIGSLKGVLSGLPYLQELGIGAVWLTPFYPSPMIDNGYDISLFTDINPLFGSLEDFDALISEAEKRDIKVITDLVLNHTSTSHPWFKESRSSVGNPKRDWYIWRKAPPNNWESFFGGTAWMLDPATDEYYYHAFHEEMADLNWDNPEVVENMLGVVKFWLERGVNGFRLDVINFLKSGTDWAKSNPFQDGMQIHSADINCSGIKRVIRELRRVTDAYPDIFLLGEVGSEDPEILSGYTGDGKLDAVFNFNLGSIKTLDFNVVASELETMNKLYDTSSILPTLFFSSHDMSRFFSRLCCGDVLSYRGVMAVLLTGRGIPFIYQGDEIGISDYFPECLDDFFDIKAVQIHRECLDSGSTEEDAFKAAFKECRDFSRNIYIAEPGCRTALKTGMVPFSLPYGEDEIVRQSSDADSSLNWCKKLIKLRTENSVFQEGCRSLICSTENALIFESKLNGESWITAVNTGSESIMFPEPMKTEFLLETGSSGAVLEASGAAEPATELPGKTIQIFKVDN